MVVDLGEANVLVGEQAQLVDGGLDGGRARRDALEQLAQLVLVDGSASYRCGSIIAPQVAEAAANGPTFQGKA